jgi:hypothetical protein
VQDAAKSWVAGPGPAMTHKAGPAMTQKVEP